MITRLALGLLLCCPVLALGAGDQAPQPDPFEKGVEAYRAGDYAAALAAFLEARPAGWSAANLQFNLGLTYYKLRRYDEARAVFQQLRQYPGYAPIADYHLALIAAQLGERERAIELLQPIAASAPQAAMRDRAGIALGRIEPAPSSGPGAFISVAAGYDSNAALLDEGAQPAGGSDSPNVDLLATYESVVSHTEARDYDLLGGGYVREYAEENGLDQAGAFATLSREREAGEDHRIRASLEAAASALEGHHFLDAFGASYGIAPRIGAGGGALGAQLTRVEAASAYGYLEGWRLRGNASWTARSGTSRWRLSDLFEANDRADLAVGPDFFSHSPIRNGVALAVPRNGPAGWHVQWNLGYRYSWYRDPDRSGPTVERRIDTLLEAGARIARQLSSGLFFFADYQFSRNDSSIDAFTYDRHLLQVGVEWTSRGR